MAASGVMRVSVRAGADDSFHLSRVAEPAIASATQRRLDRRSDAPLASASPREARWRRSSYTGRPYSAMTLANSLQSR